jgi:hypothetical protein
MKLSVAVNGQIRKTINWDGACKGPDCNSNGRDWSGSHNASKHYFVASNFSVNTGPVSDTDNVTVAFSIMNLGDAGEAQQFSQGAAAFTKAACNANNGQHPSSACTLQPLVGLLVSLGFPNCDGPIANDGRTWTGTQLSQVANVTQDKAAYLISNVRYNGPNSPAGCGGNAIYRVNLAAWRTS